MSVYSKLTLTTLLILLINLLSLIGQVRIMEAFLFLFLAAVRTPANKGLVSPATRCRSPVYVGMIPYSTGPAVHTPAYEGADRQMKTHNTPHLPSYTTSSSTHSVSCRRPLPPGPLCYVMFYLLCRALFYLHTYASNFCPVPRHALVVSPFCQPIPSFLFSAAS